MEPVSEQIAKFLKLQGVKYVVLCSGSRNKFLINAFVNHFKVFDHFDERSAAFFSLGINKYFCALKSIVCMTSGTAVAEAFPAVIEAYYSGTSLLVISADLPGYYPEGFFPQKIDQRKIFGKFAEFSQVDGSTNSKLILDLSRPNHWNVCYEEDDFLANLSFVVKPKAREPKVMEEVSSKKLYLVSHIYKPLTETQKKQISLLQKTNCMVDSFNSREIKSLVHSNISPTEFFSKTFSEIVIVGGRPNFRAWRSVIRSLVIDKKIKLKVIDIENSKFKFVEKQGILKTPMKAQNIPNYPEAFLLNSILRTFARADFFIGNSLLAYIVADLKTQATVFGNRGANGVDGLVSTFAGLCVGASLLVGCIGDLSFLYDTQGLHLLKNLPTKNWLLFVFNNKGGLIFKRFALDEGLTIDAKNILRLKHNYSLRKAAEIYGLPYTTISKPKDLKRLKPPLVVEILICD